MDKQQSWDQVDEILDVLKSSCYYLDFPDADISDFFVEAGKPQGPDVTEMATSPLSPTKLLLGGVSDKRGQFHLEKSPMHQEFEDREQVEIKLRNKAGSGVLMILDNIDEEDYVPEDVTHDNDAAAEQDVTEPAL